MSRRKRVYLINGPNLQRLGTREPEIYGRTTLAEIEREFTERAAAAGYEAVCLQSDSEAEIVASIHRAIDDEAAIVINPAAFTHYSFAIADALAQARGPVVEVHISNPHSREDWRRRSLVSPYATGTIAGFGAASYSLALEAVAILDSRLPSSEEGDSAED